MKEPALFVPQSSIEKSSMRETKSAYTLRGFIFPVESLDLK